MPLGNLCTIEKKIWQHFPCNLLFSHDVDTEKNAKQYILFSFYEKKRKKTSFCVKHYKVEEIVKQFLTVFTTSIHGGVCQTPLDAFRPVSIFDAHFTVF